LSQQTAFLNMAIIIGFNALMTSCVNPQSQAQALAAAGEATRLWQRAPVGSMGYAIVATSSGAHPKNQPDLSVLCFWRINLAGYPGAVPHSHPGESARWTNRGLKQPTFRCEK